MHFHYFSTKAYTNDGWMNFVDEGSGEENTTFYSDCY